MSIRWIRNVKIDGEENVLEIQMGYKTIGDRCYTRIGTELEEYFVPTSEFRDEILEEGKAILKNKLSSKSITTLEGEPYDWE